MSKDSLCILPFIHIAGKTQGTYRLCCVSSLSLVEPRVKMGSTKIEDVWNNEFYRNVRLDMIAGKRFKDCQICYQNEDRGLTSKRQEHNITWKHKLGEERYNDIINQAKENEGRLKSQPMYFDLRLGNLCNLKCRMCGSSCSTSIKSEWEELLKENDLSEFEDQADSYSGSKYVKDWYLKDSFWNDFEKYIPYIERIYFTGGEPMLIKSYITMLENVIANGRTNIEIVLNSNMTILNHKILNILSQFESLVLSISIDGTGSTNEYIRYPSKWPELFSNFKELYAKGIRFELNYTLSAYNFFESKEFFLEMRSHFPNVTIHWNILLTPEYLDYRILPLEIREEYISTLTGAPELDSLKKQLTTNEVHSDEFKRFKNYTKVLDKHRQQDIFTMIPSLLRIKDYYEQF